MAIAEPLPLLDPARPRIAALADARGMDAKAVASKVGVNPRTVRFWLTGERLPSLPVAVRLADALGVPVHVLAPTPAQAAREGLAMLAAETKVRRTWSISKVHDYLRCGACYTPGHKDFHEPTGRHWDFGPGQAL